jgi:hypothetical protein
VPLSGPSVNLAGKPARVGGAFAMVAGVLVFVIGLSFAFGVWLLTFALATPGIALALALPIALMTLLVGALFLGGGRRLGRAGNDAERGMREQALLALAAEKGGITATDAARAVGMSIVEADAMLTAVAKREPERLSVDVDDQGAVWFRAAAPAPHVRVGNVDPQGRWVPLPDEERRAAEAREAADEDEREFGGPASATKGRR